MVNKYIKFEMEKTLNLDSYILKEYVECKPLETTLDVVFVDQSLQIDDGNSHGQEKCADLILPFSCTKLKWVTVKKSATLLHTDDSTNSKSIMELTFNIKDWPEFSWECGDTIGILPRNAEQDVDALLNLLRIMDKSDTCCYIQAMLNKKKTIKIPPHIPKQTTPREILKDCLDIGSALKKQFLRSLADYCSNDIEKQFLKILSSKEGSEFYNDIILTRRFTLLNILKICNSCQPPLNLLVQHLPRLLPRCYSIASSYLQNSHEFTIVFSIVGLTTKMLENNPEKVLMYLRRPTLSNGKGVFRYTFNDFKSNQVLIAVGTGLAPFLGFLQHKQCLLEQQQQQQHNEKSHNDVGCTWLIVGATSPKAIIHRNQLLKWQSTNILNEFIECHSHIVPSTAIAAEPSKYLHIQDALLDHSKEFIDLLLQPHTYLYICADGGAQISKSLVSCICECLCNVLKITRNEAEDIIQNLRKKHKFREDLWT